MAPIEKRAVLTLKLVAIPTILLALLIHQNGSQRAGAALAGTIHYPDLQTVIPLDEFSIIQPTLTTREFRYTHIISNLGDGPLEIDPTYDAATDSARGVQVLYTHDALNFWSRVTQRPIVGTFKYHSAHGHLHFPLARFGLYEVRPDGSVGAPVVLAPKIGFCIADSLPMAPSIPHLGVRGYGSGACAVAGATLGISVGYGDLYNFVDDGQSIDITALPDGIYWFRAISDLFNYFVETNETNNVTDIKVQISGTTVTLLTGPVYPDSTPPTVALTAPPAGQVSGTNVILSADASDPAGIKNVQFVLDGEPLGPPLIAPPYNLSWDTTTTADGVHYLSAHAEAGSGFFGSATPVEVTVSNAAAPPPPPSPLTITNVAPINRTSTSVTITWTTSEPATSQVDYGLDANYGSVVTDATMVVSHAMMLTGLSPATSYHYRVTSQDGAGNVATTGDLIFSTAAVSGLSCTVTAPTEGSTVAGAVTVSATAVGTASIAGVQFLLDGANLGAETATPPYSTLWTTTAVNDGPHTLTCVARDPTGNTATSPPVTVTVANAPPPQPGLVAAYSFDQGTGSSAPDASGNANTGTLQNATWTAQGRYGAAMSFNGTNAWVSVADSPSLDLTQGMTLEAWVYPTSLDANWRTVVLKERPAGLAYALYATDGASRPPAGYVNTGLGDVAAIGPGTLPLNAWTHLATTYDGSMLRLYVDGGEVSSQVVSGSLVASDSPLRIGGNAVWGEYFAGRIDEARVYNRALSAAAIQQDMLTPVAAPDTTPPTVSIDFPTLGVTVGATLNVTATAQDNAAVAGVQFLLDGANLGSEDTAAPYSVAWNTTLAADGPHTLSAVARDASGNTATAAGVAVIVDNADQTAPTVSITSPAIGSTVSASITVTADAADNVGVAGVQFMLDGVNLGAEDPAAPYAVSWSTATASNGAHSLTAVARDAAGNTTQSGAVSVTVSNPIPDTTPPTVSVTSPSDGATVAGSVSVSATAADNVGVAGVQFMLDGVNLGAEDPTAPYSVNWNTTTTSNGPHVLSASARDAAGNRTDSAGVIITVSNDAPGTGLVAAYSFNAGEGSTLIDASGNGNTGSILDASWKDSGQYGGTLSFDGKTDRVDINDAASLDLTTGMTLEAWVYSKNVTNWRTVVMKEVPGRLSYALYANEGGGRPAAYIYTGGPVEAVFGTEVLADETWTHLAATYDGAMLRLYVNGVQVASRAVTGSLAVSADPLRIGGNAVWGEYFRGLIDEVRIYNRALTAAEILSDMSTPVP